MPEQSPIFHTEELHHVPQEFVLAYDYLMQTIGEDDHNEIRNIPGAGAFARIRIQEELRKGSWEGVRISRYFMENTASELRQLRAKDLKDKGWTELPDPAFITENEFIARTTIRLYNEARRIIKTRESQLKNR